jgi:hypothetical protein
VKFVAVYCRSLIEENITMESPRRKFLHLVAGAVALPAISRGAEAQAYPTRPVRIIVPFARQGHSKVDVLIGVRHAIVAAS